MNFHKKTVYYEAKLEKNLAKLSTYYVEKNSPEIQ